MAEPDDTIVANLWPVFCALAHSATLNEINHGRAEYWALLAALREDLAESMNGAHGKVRTRCKRLHAAVQPLFSERAPSKSQARKALDDVKKHNIALYDFWEEIVRHEAPKTITKADFTLWVGTLSPSEKLALLARLQGDNMDA